MVRRALLLALALTLAALPAWAGIVPSFGGAHVDSFRNGQYPDANFAGITGTWIRHDTANGDSLNGGLDTTTAISATQAGFRLGGTATVVQRQLVKLVFGGYLPTSAIIDSIFMRLNSTGTLVNAADTLLGAVVVRAWTAGLGDGNFTAGATFTAADTTGASWAAANNVPLGSRTAWGLRGADSCFTSIPGQGTARATAHSAQEQALGGTLNYDGGQDREGSFHYCGAWLTAGVKDFNVSFMRFIYNNLAAAQNYGIELRAVNGEALSGNHRVYGQGPWCTTVASRLMFIVYWHDTRSVVQIGGGE